MPRRRTSVLVQAQYYTWRLTTRSGVWCADGRSNAVNLGRHSLGTRDDEEAKKLIVQLDLRCAVSRGRADRTAIRDTVKQELLLEDGRKLYLENAARPRVTGGIRQTSQKRYRAVFDKFLVYAKDRGLQSWNAVDAQFIGSYLTMLEKTRYSYSTQYLEGTTIKQAINWMVQNGYLKNNKPIELKLRKPQGTSTHCWTDAEFQAIVEFCRSHTQLNWLANVVITLGATGFRISELAALRWNDLDLANGMIHLVDESTIASKSGRPNISRTLKSGRSRSLPMNEDLQKVLTELSRHQDGFVFHGPLGGRIKPDTIRNILIRDVLSPLAACNRKNLSEYFADGRLHSFRHYFCSRCANRGVPQQVLMQWLGHRESGMVQHYYHLHDQESKRQMARIQFGKTAGMSPAE